MHKCIKKIKVGSSGYATTIVFNPNDLCIAVGTSGRQVKYYELTDYTLVSSTTIQDNIPRKIEFVHNSEHDGICFVGFDDSTKAFQLDVDNGKPKLLDFIAKPYRQTLDLRLDDECKYLYCLQANTFCTGQSSGGDPTLSSSADRIILQHTNLSKINLDPKKPIN